MKEESKIKEKVRQLDLLGQTYDLKYKNSAKFQTVVGGIFSVVVVVLVGVATLIFIRNGLDTTNPDVSMSTSISHTLPKRDLYLHSYSVGFNVYLSPSKIVKTQDVSKYFTVIMYIYELAKGPNDTVVENLIA